MKRLVVPFVLEEMNEECADEGVVVIDCAKASGFGEVFVEASYGKAAI